MTTHEPIPLQWFKDNLPPQLEVFGLPGILDPMTCAALSGQLDRLGGRKHVFTYPYPLLGDHELPEGLDTAIRLAERFKTPTNTAILKRYDINDPYTSAAYTPHHDPDVYGTQRLALMSLSGRAELAVVTSDGQTHSLRCEPGTAYFVDPGILHWVTEPLNPEGVRDFLFLGYAT